MMLAFIGAHPIDADRRGCGFAVISGKRLPDLMRSLGKASLSLRRASTTNTDENRPTRREVPQFCSLEVACFGMHPMEMMIVGIVALLLFGKRLPEVARSLGKGYGIQKKGVRGLRRGGCRAVRRHHDRPVAPSRKIALLKRPLPNSSREVRARRVELRFDVVRSTHRQTPDKPGYFARSRVWFACLKRSANLQACSNENGMTSRIRLGSQASMSSRSNPNAIPRTRQPVLHGPQQFELAPDLLFRGGKLRGGCGLQLAASVSSR